MYRVWVQGKGSASSIFLSPDREAAVKVAKDAVGRPLREGDAGTGKVLAAWVEDAGHVRVASFPQ